MLAGFKLNSEIRSFKRNRLTRAALVILVLMPLLYSALYLWAFWNPFGNLNALPVALVNSDKGTSVDGKELRAGDKVIEGLKENDQISWIETDSEDARRGVESGEYYFSLELPENFSDAVASPTSGKPEKANLISTYNDANGYLSTMIGQNVMREVLNVVGDKISAEAVDKVLLGIVDAGSGMQRAAIGAGKLADGTAQLKDGSVQLNDGAEKLANGLATAKDGSGKLRNGAVELDDGIAKLHQGAGTLSDGTTELSDKVNAAAEKINGQAGKLNQLEGGVDKLGDGASRLNDGVQQLNTKLGGVTKAQGDHARNLRDISRNLRGSGMPAAITAANELDKVALALETQGIGPKSQNATDLKRLADGSAQLSYQLNDPNAPLRKGVGELSGLPAQFKQLQDGVNKINNGAHKLDDKLGEASAGATKLKNGVIKLDDGNTKLKDGADKLKDGTAKAKDGTAKLNNGATELRDKLSEGSKKVPQWDEGQRLAASSTIGGPVQMKADNDSGTHTFGAGMAPFFFSMSLFIGGIMVYVMIKPLQARTVNSGMHSWRAALSGFLPTGIIAILQAAVVVAVTIWGVGMDTASVPGLFLFAALVALVWMLMNQMLIAFLGPGPGRVTALAMLMLMILASGGLYPVETQNKFFQFLHPFDPMTYAVNGFRQLIYGFYDERLPIAVGVLCLVGLGCFLVTTLSARSQQMWTMKRLHPVLNA
ncbi:YhgE/Pip domain-containing protein [Corynebacterium macclintockiae]|uniref:YhgE/Pip domain-containing protein n=1 Tax=Corynebacterium macclintockiae TaxID=2913501 RepID=UPI00254C4F77|nr:YhgE/Pip domain-containing protein [Corynebacterium macclintockiae]MDK8890004.1 YhgE/Pip domain-containing protein [Corynebacterium macclintockiae]